MAISRRSYFLYGAYRSYRFDTHFYVINASFLWVDSTIRPTLSDEEHMSECFSRLFVKPEYAFDWPFLVIAIFKSHLPYKNEWTHNVRVLIDRLVG